MFFQMKNTSIKNHWKISFKFFGRGNYTSPLVDIIRKPSSQNFMYKLGDYREISVRCCDIVTAIWRIIGIACIEAIWSWTPALSPKKWKTSGKRKRKKIKNWIFFTFSKILSLWKKILSVDSKYYHSLRTLHFIADSYSKLLRNDECLFAP